MNAVSTNVTIDDLVLIFLALFFLALHVLASKIPHLCGRRGAVPVGQLGQRQRAAGQRAPCTQAFPHQPLGAGRREVARERQPRPTAPREP
jgi:hypothetical protein